MTQKSLKFERDNGLRRASQSRASTRGGLPPAMTRYETLAALAEYAATGDVAHRNRVVVGCMRFVAKRANHFSPQGRNFDDILQAGCEGLMRATETFDPEKGAFLTYARQWIDRYMIMFLRAESHMVAPPSYVRMTTVEDAIRDGANSIDEVVEHARAKCANGDANHGMRHDVAAGIMHLLAGWDVGAEFVDLSGGFESADDAAIRAEQERAVADALAMLTVRQRETVERLYWEDERRVDVAADFGVTKERVRQIANRAFEKMRKQLREVA